MLFQKNRERKPYASSQGRIVNKLPEIFTPRPFCFWRNLQEALVGDCFTPWGFPTWMTIFRNPRLPCLSVSTVKKLSFLLIFCWTGFSYFLRMLGPAIGYALASFCLKIYISPTLTPTTTLSDPRWLGAWWLGKKTNIPARCSSKNFSGWLILGAINAVFGFLIGLFPKTLPRAAVRRAIALEKNKGKPREAEEAASFSGDILH